MSLQRREYVAVIDDTVDVLEVFTIALKAAGLKVRGFDDPLMAVAHLYEYHRKYSIVLTDMRMPGMDGFQLSSLIHQMDEEIRIVCMSAFESYEREIGELQIEKFIKKPIHIPDLVSTIKQLIPAQAPKLTS